MQRYPLRLIVDKNAGLNGNPKPLLDFPSAETKEVIKWGKIPFNPFSLYRFDFQLCSPNNRISEAFATIGSR
jgi:hypothetical protein